MLKYIDVFLGVALVMLGVSLIITMVTQMISFAFNFRGKRLRDGLADLLLTLPGGLSGNATAKTVAEAILKHKLLVDGVGSNRLAPAISRVDLANLLSTPALLESALAKEVTDRLAALAADVDRWFDATMSRVANRFALQTRVVTIVASVVMAFALQLDVFGLTKTLFADSDLRASLVGTTQAMLGTAEEVLTPATVYRDVAATVAAESHGVLPAAPPPTLANRDAATKWIRDTLDEDPAKADELVNRYEALLQDALKAKLPGMIDKIAGVRDDLERGGKFRLIPEPYAPWQFGSIWVFLGVVASAGLLSLGAPFWFNMLKTASNLRPPIAAHVDSRKRSEGNVDPAGAGSSSG